MTAMVRKKTLHEMDDAMIARAARDYVNDSVNGQAEGIPQDYLWDVMEATRRDPAKLIALQGGQERFQKMGEQLVAKVNKSLIDANHLDQQR